MKTFLTQSALSAAILLAASGAQAGTIYECNGIYTDKPSAECRTKGRADLPPIGKYTSAKPKTAYQAGAAAHTADAPVRTAKRASRLPPPVRPAAQQAAYKTPQPAGAAAYAPQTGDTAKPAGSSGRRTILEQELNNERKALAQAQADLIRARTVKNGISNPQQISGLQSHVLDRQQNIQALQRELGRM